MVRPQGKAVLPQENATLQQGVPNSTSALTGPGHTRRGPIPRCAKPLGLKPLRVECHVTDPARPEGLSLPPGLVPFHGCR